MPALEWLAEQPPGAWIGAGLVLAGICFVILGISNIKGR